VIYSGKAASFVASFLELWSAVSDMKHEVTGNNVLYVVKRENK
jgi:hypothetical protein